MPKQTHKKNIIHKIPVVADFIKQIDSDFEEFGLQRTMMNIIRRTKTRLKTYGKNQDLENILKNEPVVVVSNHPYEAETIGIVASLPPREDTSLIISAKSVGICPNLNKYLIPVHIEHHINNKSGMTFWDRILNIIYPMPSLSEEEEHRKNIESIKEASNRIKKGGMIIMFPGRRGVGGRWFSGIGHLLKGASNKKKVYVVKIYFRGSSHLDYFRLVPGIRHFLPKAEIFFDKARAVNDIFEEHPKQIAAILEKEYNQWMESVKTSI